MFPVLDTKLWMIKSTVWTRLSGLHFSIFRLRKAVGRLIRPSFFVVCCSHLLNSTFKNNLFLAWQTLDSSRVATSYYPIVVTASLA
jgi:hypothetical protein